MKKVVSIFPKKQEPQYIPTKIYTRDQFYQSVPEEDTSHVLPFKGSIFEILPRDTSQTTLLFKFELSQFQPITSQYSHIQTYLKRTLPDKCPNESYLQNSI